MVVGQMLGYGAPNDRVKRPICGELMKTTLTRRPRESDLFSPIRRCPHTEAGIKETPR